MYVCLWEDVSKTSTYGLRRADERVLSSLCSGPNSERAPRGLGYSAARSLLATPLHTTTNKQGRTLQIFDEEFIDSGRRVVMWGPIDNKHFHEQIINVMECNPKRNYVSIIHSRYKYVNTRFNLENNNIFLKI